MLSILGLQEYPVGDRVSRLSFVPSLFRILYFIFLSFYAHWYFILLTYLPVLSRIYQFLFNYLESRTYVNFLFGILCSLIFHSSLSSFYFDLFFYACITLSYIALYGYLLYFTFYFHFVLCCIWRNGLREVTRQFIEYLQIDGELKNNKRITVYDLNKEFLVDEFYRFCRSFLLIYILCYFTLFCSD